jgi:hypothetical protein
MRRIAYGIGLALIAGFIGSRLAALASASNPSHIVIQQFSMPGTKYSTSLSAKQRYQAHGYVVRCSSGQRVTGGGYHVQEGDLPTHHMNL